MVAAAVFRIADGHLRYSENAARASVELRYGNSLWNVRARGRARGRALIVHDAY